jgi:hypothetical protein
MINPLEKPYTSFHSSDNKAAQRDQNSLFYANSCLRIKLLGMKLRFLLAALFIPLFASCDVLLLIILLSSSNGGPAEAVNFNTDARILRGAWVLKLTKPDRTVLPDVTLDFSATYNDSTSYGFTTPAKIESETFNFVGRFEGGRDQTLIAPQFSAGFPANLWGTFNDASEKSILIMRFFEITRVDRNNPKYIGEITDIPIPGNQPKTLYSFSLIRQ